MSTDEHVSEAASTHEDDSSRRRTRAQVKKASELTEYEAFTEIRDILSRRDKPGRLGDSPWRLSDLCRHHGMDSFLDLTTYVDASSFSMTTRYTVCPEVLVFAGNIADTELISRWMMNYITDYGESDMDREDYLGNSDIVLQYLDLLRRFRTEHPEVPLEIAVSMNDLFDWKEGDWEI